MKFSLLRPSSCLLALTLTCLFSATSNGDIVLTNFDDAGFQVGGTTQTFEGSLATFPQSATPGSEKYSSNVISGTDQTVTIDATPVNNDFFVNYAPTALDINGATAGTGLDVATYRYVEVFYSLDSDFSGSTHQIRLDTTNQVAAFDTFVAAEQMKIPDTTGAHRIILDLKNSNSPINWTGEWEVFRWDFFNNGGNQNKSFTIDKIVYGSEISAVPEPTSLAMFGIAVVGLAVRRKRRVA